MPLASEFALRASRHAAGWLDSAMSHSRPLRRRPPMLAAALFALSQMPSLATAAPVASHCTAEESTLFACSAEAVLHRAAFVLPKVEADWRAATRAGRLMLSGGGGAYLAFANPPYRYIVYTAIGSGWGSKAGVVVEKHGRRIANLRCVYQATSALGPDLFERAGIVEDPLRLELP